MDYQSLRLEKPTLPLLFSQDTRGLCWIAFAVLSVSLSFSLRFPKDGRNLMFSCSETADILGSRRGGVATRCEVSGI